MEEGLGETVSHPVKQSRPIGTNDMETTLETKPTDSSKYPGTDATSQFRPEISVIERFRMELSVKW